MKTLFALMVIALTASAACSEGHAALEVKPGSAVTLQKKDGVTISGRLIEVKPEHLVVETRTGRTEVKRADVTALRTDSTMALNDPGVRTEPVGSTGSDAPAVTPAANVSSPSGADEDGERRSAGATEYREVTLPAGTVLPVELTTRVGSEVSNVEDTVRGRLRHPLTVHGVQAFPAGTAVIGHVTSAERSARVKGRARVAFRFTSIDPPGDAERLSMRTDTVSRLAPATKKTDAAKIGGGAAGTGVVLSTRGKEVTLPAGTPVSVRLAAPLTVRVATSR
jgi:hypothetical protein